MSTILPWLRSATLAIALTGGGATYAAPAPASQPLYATPDEAVAALVSAIRQGQATQIRSVLGPGSDSLVQSGDPVTDAESRKKFLAAYDEKHTLRQPAPDRQVLSVGNNEWPLPIPLVMIDGRWRWDSKAGAQELIDRRIGQNELAAIRTSLAYVDAQQAYYRLMKQANEPQFAQRLIAQAGTMDGLYWPTDSDAGQSPLAAVIADAREHGYPGVPVSGRQVPYLGYYFRVLTAQGPNASGGAKDYIVKGRMTEGFALVAWPAGYGSSGVMTFVVNQDGTVYQKDLGARTAAAAKAMTRFDPDLTWTRVDIAN